MNAMTSWDWESQSVWSQQWGAGHRRGVDRDPADPAAVRVGSLADLLEHRPDAKVLADERADLTYGVRYAIDRFVIGVSIGDAATGFYFG